MTLFSTTLRATFGHRGLFQVGRDQRPPGQGLGRVLSNSCPREAAAGLYPIRASACEVRRSLFSGKRAHSYERSPEGLLF
jgi:hypothetical protein